MDIFQLFLEEGAHLQWLFSTNYFEKDLTEIFDFNKN